MKILCLTIIGSNKNVVSKILFCPQKNVCVQKLSTKILSSKNVWVQTVLGKKNLDQKEFWVQKILGPKILGPTKFSRNILIRKTIGSEIFLGPNKFYDAEKNWG